MDTRRKAIRIVIADDSPEDVSHIKNALTASGLNCDISTVYNGLQLLDFLTASNAYTGVTNNVPDLVLLDMGMPFMNGHAVLLKMKGAFEFRKTPVYILSENSDPADLHLIQNGASGYYKKPEKPEDYHAIIREILKEMKLLS